MNGELEITKTVIEKQFVFKEDVYILSGSANFDVSESSLQDFNASISKETEGQPIFLGSVNGWNENGSFKVNTSNIPLEDSEAVSVCVKDLIVALTAGN